MNKKAYITPDFEVIDMQTENLIAASNITIDKGDGDAPGFGAFSKTKVTAMPPVLEPSARRASGTAATGWKNRLYTHLSLDTVIRPRGFPRADFLFAER